jgi:ABC-2 type transport system ATP-binding protein
MQLVDLQNVSRSFGHVRALREVTLSLAPGTIGLVGNNGAGKSTLLKILLGLLRPDLGSGTILGCDIRSSGNTLRGRVGYMPEVASVVPVLLGVEFVTLAGDLYGMPHRDARRRAHEVLNYVGLGELRYRRLEEYSSGNQQRLKLAAALVHDPELLLLDEPTNGLDPAGRVSMLRLIEDLIAETGKSVILCTHLLGDVERLCQQVVVLDRGTVVRAGSMAELRRTINNRYDLGWQGDGDAFLAALERAGAALVGARNGQPHARVEVPSSWSTITFFEVARASHVTITQLKPEEEDLQGAFFRMTDRGTAPSAPLTPPTP